jgi:hypothetical protein
MKLLRFTDINGQELCIVAEKITGFVDCQKRARGCGNTFIATGADDSEGGENGWYVSEKFEVVAAIIQDA